MLKQIAGLRRGTTSFLVTILFIGVPVSTRAQDVIDRVVAVVGTQIITLSDLRIEKTIRDVLGEPLPKDDRDLLNELIDQRLIRAELDQYREEAPTEAELDEQFGQIQDLKGLPAETVREAIREHLRVHRFFSERFGRFTNISEAELQKYYDEVFIPTARARGLSTFRRLDEVREDIRTSVIDAKTAADVRRWLDHLRRIARIEILNFN